MTADHRSSSPAAPDAVTSARRPRLCVVTTVGSSIQVLYRGRLEYLREQGFEVTVVCAPSELDESIRARGVTLHTVPMTRAITPGRDLRAWWRLRRLFQRERFDLIEVGTPKAALLGTLAARAAGSRSVVHILHGLSYEGRRGLVGWLLRQATGVPCRLAHRTYSVSASLREQAERDGLCPPGTIRMIGHGSCNGVDVARFAPAGRAEREAVRARHDIPRDAVVVGFLGRLVHDKGLGELVAAFEGLAAERREVVLLVVGAFEPRDHPPAHVVDFLRHHARVRHAGWQEDPRPYFAAMDLVALPSHREGLGMVLLEAAAMEIPVVASDATGCRDALVPGETGLMVPVRDSARLRDALRQLVADGELRARLGRQGRAWVCAHFDQRKVWGALVEEYRGLLEEARGATPIMR